MKKAVIAAIILMMLLLSACGTAENAPSAVANNNVNSGAEDPVNSQAAAYKLCQVTDVGGIDDKSFNETAWYGVELAEKDFDVEGKFLESQQQTDYEKNINAFIDEDCDLIITVGFLLDEATRLASEANPDQKFAIIDVIYDPPFDNTLGLWYAIEEATFQAGYLAADVTQTGKVGVFGGIQFRSLEYFLDGYWLGVQYYNETHGTNVEVLGWDPSTRTGLFAGNFESTDDGRNLGELLMDEGADVIMPVAGPVGLGTAAAIQERGDAYLVGVDTDWCVSAPEFCDITLTSVMKLMDQSVYDAFKAVVEGTFEGGTYVGTLENGGVGLAPFHDLEDLVTDEIRADLAEIQAAIIAGEIETIPADAP